MKTYTVSELAGLAGINVRTLHHYDDNGLLKPAYVGENGYRHYGEDELLRLQQILLHRALGMPLREIAVMLDDPGFDRVQALERQRSSLVAEAARHRQMIRTIDRTIARLKEEATMTDKDLYSGLVPQKKQEEYEAWLIERFGEDARTRIEEGKSAAQWSDETREQAMRELQEIETALAAAMREGTPPQARSLDPLIERHRAWVVSQTGNSLLPKAYASLTEAYTHPDFVKRYETIAPGFAVFLTSAIQAWARRQTD